MSDENEGYFNDIQDKHEQVVEMYNYETLVLELVDEDGEIDEGDFEAVQGDLDQFKEYEGFHECMSDKLDETEETYIKERL